MKGLSIEQKAKAYDIALDKIKMLLGTGSSCSREELEYVFPELKETSGEMIRKAILELVRQSSEILEKKNQEQMIAWLEKQGEQKPANTSCLLSWTENEEKMLQSLEGIVRDYWAKAEQENNEIQIKEASDVSYFLKTVQKSPLCWIKCSDGLPNKDGIYLVVTDGRHNDVYDIARYDSIEGWHKASEIIYWMPIPQLNNKSIIEQKPAEWSEEDELNLSEALHHIRMYNLANKADKLDKWLKSIKNRIQSK